MNDNEVKPVPAEAVQPVQAPEIAQDLEHQLRAIRALATCHNLLDKAQFPHTYHQAIAESLNFLRSLHEQSMAQAISHADADKVPELALAKQQAQALKGE